MALIQCYGCSKEISNKAPACHHCGAPKEDKFELVESHYPNGQLKEKGTKKDGEWDGPLERYYKNGRLNIKSTYKDGTWNGPYEIHYENGGVMEKGTYKDGKKCGEWLDFGGKTVTYPPCPPGLDTGN